MKSANYAQAIGFLERLPQPKSWRLERMRALVEKAGIDFSGLKFIHVTGSNGKGSVCATLYSILREAHFSVGFYTSPHLVDWRERFALDGRTMSEKDFVRLLGKIKPFALQTKASQFEVLTAIALAWFSEKQPDYAVLEVGLGGRLDATNVVDAKFSAITSISLEHARQLGKTIAKIAREKSKIIKPDAVVVTPICGEALKVIKKECRAQNARLLKVPKPEKVSCDAEKTCFNSGGVRWCTSLLGFHQAENAATAVTLAKEIGISNGIIRKGLLKTEWAGRLQTLRKNPLVVLDGAHNPAGVQTLTKSFAKIFGLNPILVVGIMADKEWKKMAAVFAKGLKPSLVIATQPQNERSLKAEILAKEFSALKIQTITEKNVKKALKLGMKKAQELKKPVLVAGSLYAVWEVLA